MAWILEIKITLITGSTQLVEGTADGEIVWRLVLENAQISDPIDAPRLGFCKAERILDH